ncbi:MAG TPA: hypothetical protein VFF73_26420 [Planctomycetota bacterium]|nr:hypothetical protein [Planctomycetota bacterium]
MKQHLIRQLIAARVGKTIDITLVSGELIHAKIISADQVLEEDADFYFIDLDRAPDAKFMDEGPDSGFKPHVYSGVYREVKEVEIPTA